MKMNFDKLKSRLENEGADENEIPFDPAEEAAFAAARAAEAANASPPDRLGWWDFATGAILGAIAILVYSLWPYPGIAPETWEDAAIAAGLRPAEAIIPGFWQFAMHWVYRAFGMAGGNAAIHFAGRIAIGFSVALAYLLFREVLGLAVRLRLQHASRRYFVARFAAIAGATCLMFANPVWRLAQTFSWSTLLFTAAMWAMYRFFRFLMRGSLGSAYFTMFVLGLVAAETPLGFILLAFCWGVYLLAIRDILPFDMPLLDPYVQEISKWHMTFLFSFAFIAGIVVNIFAFVWLDGLEANGMTAGDLPLFYASSYIGRFQEAASILGWVCGAVMAVMPVVVAATLLPRATDEEQFLPYHIGALFFVLGILAYSQTAGLPALWFWLWQDSTPMVPSQFLLALFSAMSAGTVVFCIAVLGVDAFCRDHKRLVAQFFSELRSGNDSDYDDAGEPALVSGRFTSTFRQIFFMALPVALLAGLALGAPQTKTRAVLSLINEGIDETVRELTASEFLFTEGSQDAIIELKARTAGKNIVCENLMGGTSARDTYLRKRNLADHDDLLAAGIGAPALLRMWVRDKPEALRKTAVQLCFDLWKRDGRAMPPASGLVAQPLDSDETERERGVQAAYGLGEKFLAFAARYGAPSRESGHKANNVFYAIQWRLARLARIRAEMYDRKDLKSRAIDEVLFSDRLDKSNNVLKRLREAMTRVEQHAMRQMTPREGLQLALVRADFVLAKYYAEPILDADPHDPDANFAVGMSYFHDGAYARAKEYLARCLLRKPEEPAVYNNLAIAQLRTGRYDEALRNAKIALDLVPESTEIRSTLKEIEDAIRDARENEQKLEESH